MFLVGDNSNHCLHFEIFKYGSYDVDMPNAQLVLHARVHVSPVELYSATQYNKRMICGPE